MSQAQVHKKFIFNEKIDDAYLYDLYANDYAYIAEVFANSIESLKDESRVLASAFDASSLADLKKAAHKIKPLFGFTGLLHHQDSVLHFEQLCEKVSGTVNVTMQYMELIEEIKEGRNILKEDYKRLTHFLS